MGLVRLSLIIDRNRAQGVAVGGKSSTSLKAPIRVYNQVPVIPIRIHVQVPIRLIRYHDRFSIVPIFHPPHLWLFLRLTFPHFRPLFFPRSSLSQRPFFNSSFFRFGRFAPLLFPWVGCGRRVGGRQVPVKRRKRRRSLALSPHPGRALSPIFGADFPLLFRRPLSR